MLPLNLKFSPVDLVLVDLDDSIVLHVPFGSTKVDGRGKDYVPQGAAGVDGVVVKGVEYLHRLLHCLYHALGLLAFPLSLLVILTLNRLET